MKWSRAATLLALMAVAAIATACGTAASASPSPSEVAATPSPTAADSATASASAAASVTATATPDTSVMDAWRAPATQHRAMNGQQFDYECPADGTLDDIWGTDIYTDDSSVCSAGVHVGLITLEEGGTVTIEMRAGEDEYQASERNGVTSNPYPAWGGSFIVIED